MATEKNEQKDAKKGWGAVLIGPVILAVLFIPTTIVLFTMMLPTGIVAAIDKHRPRALTMTVGTLNFSGAVAVWLELLLRGHSFSAATALSTDMDYLMIAYGSAAAGVVIYGCIVPLVAGISARASEAEKVRIQKQQEHLVQLWGRGIIAGQPAAPEKR